MLKVKFISLVSLEINFVNTVFISINENSFQFQCSFNKDDLIINDINLE